MKKTHVSHHRSLQLSPASPRDGSPRRWGDSWRSVMRSHWIFPGQGVLVAFDRRPCPPARALSHVRPLTEPSPLPTTLSNWSKPPIYGSRARGLPTECSSAALPQQRLGGCSGLWAQGAGAWLVGEEENRTEGHVCNVPRRAKIADSPEKLISLHLRSW